MAKLIKESPQYRVVYDEDQKLLVWMDKITQPFRHRNSRKTFPDLVSARRDFSEGPEEWTDWIISTPDT
jgi:hypothetical protein